MPSGGNHPPEHPAPASGPGALSQRTDSKRALHPITGLPYGQNQALNQVQAAAPLASTPGPSATTRTARTPSSPGAIVPFNASTQRPNEPVTAGAALGPGPGPEALGLTAPSASGYQTALSTLQAFAASSGSTEVSALLNQFQQRN